MSQSKTSGIMLLVPGCDERRLSRLGMLDADAVIVDLEDSVPDADKDQARAWATAALQGNGDDRELWVRVNALTSSLCEADLDALASCRLTGIVAPKVESSTQVEWLVDALARRGLGDADRPTRLMAIIETVVGLKKVHEIAATSLVESLTFGSGDFSKDMGIPSTARSASNPLLVAARVEIAMASRLAELDAPHDGAYPGLDESGLVRSAQAARDLGFGTKHAVHESQVAPLRTVFGE